MALSKNLLKFLILTFALYGGWLIVYEFFLKPSGRFDHLLTENITYLICRMLDLSGYQVHYSIANKIGETFIYLNSSTFPLIRVGASCNGLELLVLFTVFIICYPGRIARKLWFIPTGLVLIYFLNVLRNFLLTLMEIHHSPYFELFHRYVFIFMVYGAIFLLWMWWAGYQQSGSTTNEKA